MCSTNGHADPRNLRPEPGQELGPAQRRAAAIQGPAQVDVSTDVRDHRRDLLEEKGSNRGENGLYDSSRKGYPRHETHHGPFTDHRQNERIRARAETGGEVQGRATGGTGGRKPAQQSSALAVISRKMVFVCDLPGQLSPQGGEKKNFPRGGSRSNPDWEISIGRVHPGRPPWSTPRDKDLNHGSYSPGVALSSSGFPAPLR